MPVVSACLTSHCVLQLLTLAPAHRSCRGAVFCTTPVLVVHPHVMQGSPQPGLFFQVSFTSAQPPDYPAEISQIHSLWVWRCWPLMPSHTAHSIHTVFATCLPVTLLLPQFSDSHLWCPRGWVHVTVVYLITTPKPNNSDASCSSCGREGMRCLLQAGGKVLRGKKRRVEPCQELWSLFYFLSSFHVRLILDAEK